MKCRVEEALLETEAACDRLHQQHANPHHGGIVGRHGAAPTWQHDLRRERCELAQRSIAPDHFLPVEHNPADVDTLLGGDVPRLHWKPAAIEVWIARLELAPPQALQYARLEAENAQQVGAGVASERYLLRKPDDGHEPDTLRRGDDGPVGRIACRSRGTGQGSDIDRRNSRRHAQRAVLSEAAPAATRAAGR